MKKDYGGFFGLALMSFIFGALLVKAVNWAYPVPAAKPAREQSWDQENLKRHDSGCPTAIFVAPHGELVQC
jgi:hypothetical protein